MNKIVLNALITSSLIMAAEVEYNDKLVTHTELGYIETQGNTKTKTFSLDTKAKEGFEKHIFSFDFDAQYASDKDQETKNKFATELNYDYDFTKRFSLGYLTGYKQDKFTAFDYQAYTGPGAKYKVIKSDTHKLSAETNILIARDDYRYTDLVDDYSAYRVKAVYEWQIVDNLKFNQDISYRGSFENVKNYFVNSKTALVSKLSNIFSAGISYKIDYVNMSGTTEYSDRTLIANLIIDY